MSSMENRPRALVIISGGVLQYAVKNTDIDVEVFDWDDFREDPVGVWQNISLPHKEMLRDIEVEIYEDIVEILRDKTTAEVFNALVFPA